MFLAVFSLFFIVIQPFLFIYFYIVYLDTKLKFFYFRREIKTRSLSILTKKEWGVFHSFCDFLLFICNLNYTEILPPPSFLKHLFMQFIAYDTYDFIFKVMKKALLSKTFFR